MKKKIQRLIIPFSGLKLGLHYFDFEITSEFFEQFDYSLIKDATANIEVAFNKKTTLLELEIQLQVWVNTYCDRCNDPIEIELNGSENLIVKFGSESYSETDEIKIISIDDYKLDITAEVYEFIHLLLPSKVVHEKIEECNPKVIAKLKEFDLEEKESNPSETVDPRWAELEKLKQAHKND